MISFLKSSSAGNNFDKFSSNDGLASSVEGDSQFVDHFLRVFAGVVHSRHSGWLLRAGSLLQAVVDHRSQRILQVRLKHIGIDRIVHGELGRLAHGSVWKERNGCRRVRDDGLESIEIKISRVVFKSGVEDRVGNLGGIAELRRKSTDFASNAQDLLAVEPEIAN